MRGKFRLSRQGETNPVAVGDRVSVLVDRDSATVESIAPRTNQLSRRAAGRRVGMEQILVANVDFAWVVQSTFLPRFNPGFVDRFLVMAQHEDIPAGIVINKADLITGTTSDDIDFWRKLYESLGYPVIYTSAVSGAGEARLRDLLIDKTTVFSGPSGVGKSSLINRMDSSLDVRTGDVSTKTRKGRHVTTNATLYTLSIGGRIVDTPGLREFGVIDIKAAELGHYFVEFRPFLHQCRYPNCTHDHEPDCAVVDAMERGEIPDGRWASYLNILASIQQGEADVGR
jgi:ribosome biogenesis GTPase